MDRRYLNTQLNHYEDYIADLENPLVELGKVVSQWWRDYQANELSLRELYLVQPVINALMALPAQTRSLLCGADLEFLHQTIQSKSPKN
jgi:hypothetical protein